MISVASRHYCGVALLMAFGLLAPFLLPEFRNQITFLWIFILFALTWDMQGGQMGYNSFGNIVFFGIGMYVAASVHIGLFFDLGEWTEAGGEKTFVHEPHQYFIGLVAGLVAAALAATAVAIMLGIFVLSMRGQYFAICTLGLGIAAGEMASGIEIIGAGAGMTAPDWPDSAGGINIRYIVFNYLAFFLCMTALLLFRFLYRSAFGLSLNAIRDNEDKAEAMGIDTHRIKVISWSISAFFLGIAGGLMGNIIGFIDPTEVAFAGATYGVWMVLMAILGGKGTLWGPVIGAMLFLFLQELFWTYLLGWQRVALGAMIVVIVVFFPQGIMGFIRYHRPEWFGEVVEEKESSIHTP